LEAETSMEAAEQNEFELVGWRLSNQPVAKVIITIILASTAGGFREFHVSDGIATGDSSDLDCPAEKRTDGHDVTERGRVSGAFERFVIETLNLASCNSAGYRTRWQRASKREQLVTFRDSAGTETRP